MRGRGSPPGGHLTWRLVRRESLGEELPQEMSRWWPPDESGSEQEQSHSRLQRSKFKTMTIKTEIRFFFSRLSRSYSSSGVSPLAHKQFHPTSSLPSPSPSYDTLTSLPSMSSGSLSGAFSSFRSRNLSTASTTSQDSSGFNMEDLVSSELCNYWHQEDSNTQVPIPLEMGNFSLNCKEMQQQEIPQTMQPMQSLPPPTHLPHNEIDIGIHKQKLKVIQWNELGRIFNIYFCRSWSLVILLWPIFHCITTPCILILTKLIVTFKVKRFWTPEQTTICLLGARMSRICPWHCQSWQTRVVCLHRMSLPITWRFMMRRGGKWLSSSWRY